MRAFSFFLSFIVVSALLNVCSPAAQAAAPTVLIQLATVSSGSISVNVTVTPVEDVAIRSQGTEIRLAGGSWTQRKTSDLSNSSFSINFTGLMPFTKYEIRGFVNYTNSTSYAYSEIISATTKGPPTVRTTSITGKSTTDISVKGSIDNNGGSAITKYGFYLKKADGTLHTAETFQGDKLGAFGVTFSNLAADTEYKAIAYAANQYGESLGDAITVRTLPLPIDPPTVTTGSYNLCTATSDTMFKAVLNGSVTSQGGAVVTERGFVIDTAANPTVGSGTVVTSGSGTGSFSTAKTGLTRGVTYHVRAYATNSGGTSYGADRTVAMPLPTAAPTSAPMPADTLNPTATPVASLKPTATPKPSTASPATPKPTATPVASLKPTATPKPLAASPATVNPTATTLQTAVLTITAAPYAAPTDQPSVTQGSNSAQSSVPTATVFAEESPGITASAGQGSAGSSATAEALKEVNPTETTGQAGYSAEATMTTGTPSPAGFAAVAAESGGRKTGLLLLAIIMAIVAMAALTAVGVVFRLRRSRRKQ